MQRLCKHPNCKSKLRADNSQGFCREHRSADPKRRFDQAKLRIRARRITFNLSYKCIKRLNSQPCYYCGANFDPYSYGLGIDRLDSRYGYSIKNVVSCCQHCNNLKGNILTAEETRSIVKLIKNLRQTDNIWDDPKTTKQKRKKRKRGQRGI